jgi:tRNA-dihydrouridine synthase B
MLAYINSPLQFGNLSLDCRLIQGPLAGFSCAPFRALFSQFRAPAYCVSEMISAQDILHKQDPSNRYLYRSPQENKLCYQISGTDPYIMAEAAIKLVALNADLIDINCGCPKNKIRKKGAGSALLEQPERLISIVKHVRAAISRPLTVKIRLQTNKKNIELAKAIADAGADALIVHGRRWLDDYDIACDWQTIAEIKNAISIPVIANGDLEDIATITQAYAMTGCDAFMISRAGTGKPWLFDSLLKGIDVIPYKNELIQLFIQHLQDLALLENEYKAVLQSKSLLRYYFGKGCDSEFLKQIYTLSSIQDIKNTLESWEF